MFQGANTKSEEDLKRDQMEKLVREELDNWSSSGSLRSGGGGSESRSGSAASQGGSRAPTAKSMYSQGSKTANRRGRRTAEGSIGSLQMETVSFHRHDCTCL